MALFKILRGYDDENKLNDITKLPLHDGYAYYNTYNNELYIDAKTNESDSNSVERHPLNAHLAYSAKYDGASNKQQIDKTYIKNIIISNNNELSFITGDDISHSVSGTLGAVTGVKGNAENSYRIGNVNITKENIGLGNVENTKLSTWAGTSNITTIGTLSNGTVPWANISDIPNSSTSTAGIIQIGSGATNAAAGNHTHTTTIAQDNTTSANQLTLAFGTKYKLTAGGTNYIFTMPTNPNTNTASAVDNILDGSNSGTAITYAPYTSQQSKLSFDTSNTNPSRTDRLNLNGYLYATKLYSGGQEVLTTHQSLSNYKTKQTEVSAATAETTTATTFVYSITQNANGEISVKTRPLPTYNNYTLPTATTSIKGGVVVGSNINVDTDGKISINRAGITTALGYTPYDSSNPNGYTSNIGTITGIKMNGASKGTTGVVDLGTVVTDVSGKLDKSGGTITGDLEVGGALTLSGNPTGNLHAATKQYVDNILSVNDAMVFKGGINGSDTFPGQMTSQANRGWTYKVSTAGYINGIKLEVGDMLICTEDNTAAATTATYPNINKNWLFIESNNDGYVIGPATSTTSAIALYGGEAGKTLTDSGIKITFAEPSSGSNDTNIPTSKAVYSAIISQGNNKQSKITASGILKGNGSGSISAATAGTDYATPTQVNAKYTKPSGGIPKDDLASAVQTSLGKADTALQNHQTVDNKDATLDWGKTTVIAKIGDTEIKVTLPDLPVYKGAGTWE